MVSSHPSPRFHYLTSFALLGALILALMWVSPGHAVDGRDFAGFYDVTNPTDLGNGAEQVTLAVQVFNYSGADISNATITLQDSSVPPKDIGGFSPAASVAAQSSVTVSASFTISQGEYALWQAGGAPNLRIDYQDSGNNSVRSVIEMTPGPVQ